MSVKIISYDLGQPETSADYEELIDFIKSLGDHVKPLESYWLVDTNKTCKYIRDMAKQHLDDNDELLVLRWSYNDWAGYGLPNNIYEWLKDRKG